MNGVKISLTLINIIIYYHTYTYALYDPFYHSICVNRYLYVTHLYCIGTFMIYFSLCKTSVQILVKGALKVRNKYTCVMEVVIKSRVQYTCAEIKIKRSTVSNKHSYDVNNIHTSGESNNFQERRRKTVHNL